jgi:hypothetical protein
VNTPTSNTREHHTVIRYSLHRIATLAPQLLRELIGRHCYEQERTSEEAMHRKWATAGVSFPDCSSPPHHQDSTSKHIRKKTKYSYYVIYIVHASYSWLTPLPTKRHRRPKFGKRFLFFLFCAVTDKRAIISQVMTLLRVSTLSCHPQTVSNQYLAKLHQYFKNSCW